ncbi:MAG: glutamine--fructose-6-phosphate transaminase (isomerizing) [Spirochaetales bacterium]|nr:glutamine--fructose-6-phosphate transaminase (isomerizing) [Spirochaetales bacterium]
MCGIIGYTGTHEVTEILLHGLKRLEYRGYDSSGIGILQKKKIRVTKKAGVLSRLSEAVDPALNGNLGIAHTRWATHGGVTDANAHPHVSAKGSVAVVHNGIIDNYQEIKAALTKVGIEFASETDSEVLAHLIEIEYVRLSSEKEPPTPSTLHIPLEHRNPAEAVARALEAVRGTYGLVVMFRDQPELLIAAKNGSPLAAGIGPDGRYIASDPLAFAAYTRQVIFMEDRELAILTPNSLSIFDATQTEIRREAEILDIRTAEVSKGQYEDYLEKEIFEQPESIRRAYGNGGRLDRDFGTARLGGIEMDGATVRRLRQATFIGMGTAMNAGIIGARMFESLARLSSQAVDASELRWSNPLVQEDSVYFALSQSGETLDTLLAIKELQNRGGKVYGIINAVGSSIARACGAGVYIHAGPEISVASTKAFTGQVTSMFLLALAFGRVRHLSPSEGQALLAALEEIPNQINQILAQSAQIQDIARKYKYARSFLFLGRGISHAVASEGALKLKELSYIHAEGFSAGNLKHGPLALVDDETPSLFIAPQGETFDKVLSNIQEVKARKGRVITVTNADSKEIEDLSDDIIRLPKCPEILSPLLTVVPLQLLALYLSRELGRNVDQPRNLAKSVTTE